MTKANYDIELGGAVSNRVDGMLHYTVSVESKKKSTWKDDEALLQTHSMLATIQHSIDAESRVWSIVGLWCPSSSSSYGEISLSFNDEHDGDDNHAGGDDDEHDGDDDDHEHDEDADGPMESHCWQVGSRHGMLSLHRCIMICVVELMTYSRCRVDNDNSIPSVLNTYL